MPPQKRRVSKRAEAGSGESDACSIREFISFLAPAIWGNKVSKPRLPSWPPDLFAIVASLLDKSGAYTRIVGDWPPTEYRDFLDETPLGDGASWAEWIQWVGDDWRGRWPLGPHREVRRWWNQLINDSNKTVSSIVDGENSELQKALLQLMAVADEACWGVGTSFFDVASLDVVPGHPPSADEFWEKTSEVLNRERPEGSSLCDRVHPSRVRVLPKSRTPSCGMTLRSLSLYLALCPGCEVKIEWQFAAGWKQEVEKHINMLLVPWPEVVAPSHFRELEGGDPPDADPGYGIFEFDPDQPVPGESNWDREKRRTEQTYRLVHKIKLMLERAKRIIGKVDIVVLPECAVTAEELDAISVPVLGQKSILIAGVRGRGPSQFCLNRVEMRVPFGPVVYPYSQAKHHRWKLEKNQIRTYGLASQLHPDAAWWEGIELARRELSVVALQPWLTFCPLICEDLARQEPMAEVIRSIGPTLVMALLMDGPQLRTRWPSRYATVLADDPGSSVLTLTSIGMVKLSRPFGDFKPSRVVALWKDPISPGAIEIELPQGSEGIVLSLVNADNSDSLERAADGRYDEETDKMLILGGVHPIEIEGS